MTLLKKPQTLALAALTLAFLGLHSYLFRPPEDLNRRTIASSHSPDEIRAILDSDDFKNSAPLVIGQPPESLDQLLIGDLDGQPYDVQTQYGAIVAIESAGIYNREPSSDQPELAQIKDPSAFLHKHLQLFEKSADGLHQLGMTTVAQGTLIRMALLSGSQTLGEVHMLLDSQNRLLSLSRQ